MGQGARHLGFSYSGRPKEKEAANRTRRRFEPRPRAANGPRQCADGLLLRDDALVKLFFHAQQLLRLFFLDAGDRYSGPAADHVLNVFATDNASSRVVEVVLVAHGAQALALLALFVGVEASLLEFMIGNRRMHA